MLGSTRRRWQYGQCVIFTTVVVEVAHGRCLQRGVADRGDVALDGFDGQAAELLEQALVVGEHVGRQRGGKRGAFLSGGFDLSLEVGGLGAGGQVSAFTPSSNFVMMACARASRSSASLWATTTSLRVCSILSRRLARVASSFSEIQNLAVVGAVDVALLGGLDGVVGLDPVVLRSSSSMSDPCAGRRAWSSRT